MLPCTLPQFPHTGGIPGFKLPAAPTPEENPVMNLSMIRVSTELDALSVQEHDGVKGAFIVLHLGHSQA